MTREFRDDVPDGKFHHRIVRFVRAGTEEVKLGFEWSGGAYIQVCRGDAFALPQEVINVWEYASDSPRIRRTDNAMSAEVTRWIEEYGENGAADLIHDVQHNWGR